MSRKSSSTSGQQPLRLLEAGVTLFRPAEIQVVIVPVGQVPPELWLQYCSLVTKHRLIELQLLRSFYKEQQKSPLTHLPWKAGALHFRFPPEGAGAQKDLMTPLHTHRKVLGVIGICHGAAMEDIKHAYESFGKSCRAFPDALAQRCFFFEPTDAQVAEDKVDMPELMMFPPTESGGPEQLSSHAEVVMLDFATAMLSGLERWMLTAGPAMVDLNTFCDTSDKLMSSVSVLDEVQKRLYTDEEMTRKRRYGRLQKAMGDVALLAGSPVDAIEHYTTAMDLSKACSDVVWTGAALAGIANAKVLEACVESGALRGGHGHTESESTARLPAIARLQAEDTSSVDSRASSGFGGVQFWDALRQVKGLESEVRYQLTEARIVLRRRSVIPLMVEHDLAWVRLLIGLHATRARSEVNEIVSGIVEMGAALQFTEDKLTNIMEAAQVMGMVGSLRKRVLLLWQAVEFSRSSERPNLTTLQIARKALEPPDMLEEDAGEQGIAPAVPAIPVGTPQHWSAVRCGCIEGVLATAILAGQHADVWEAASMLLREHYRELAPSRQQSLQRTLEAAANQMPDAARKRTGPGPPPLLSLLRPLPGPAHLQPHRMLLDVHGMHRLLTIAESGTAKSINPFIYNPFKPVKVKGSEQPVAPASEAGSICWICGEVATVEVEIRNPTVIPIKVERLTLDVEWAGHPSVAPADKKVATQAKWKPNPVAMWLPAETPATKVLLTGVPLTAGLFTVTGCQVTAMGVSWKQPWLPRHAFLGQSHSQQNGAKDHGGGLAQARVSVVDPLPLVRARIETPSTSVAPSMEQPAATPSVASPDTAASAPKTQDEQAAIETVKASALKGQILTTWLNISNIGKLPVTAAMVSVEQQTSAGAMPAQRPLPAGGLSAADMPSMAPSAPYRPPAATVRATVDERHLQSALPLGQNGRVRVPILFHANQVASYIGDEDANLHLHLEYAANIDASNETIGRKCTLSVHLLFLPSLEVTSVTFHEHHLLADVRAPDMGSKGPGMRRSSSLSAIDRSSSASADRTGLSKLQNADGGSATYTDSGVSRVCVMEVEAINSADVGLQVWLGRRVTPEHHSADWQALLDSPRPWAPKAADTHIPLNAHCKLVAAKQRVTVACIVDCTAVPLSDKLAGRDSAAGPGAVDTELVAEELCSSFCLYWRHEDLHDAAIPVEIGALPLPRDHLVQSLDMHALTLLCPPPIGPPLSISFRALRCAGGKSLVPCELQEVLAPGNAVTETMLSRMSLWGVHVPLGDVLLISAQVNSHREGEHTVEWSVSCHDSRFLVGEAHCAFESMAAVAAAQLAGFQDRLDGRAQASRKIAVTFLQSGLFRLSAQEVSVLPKPAAGRGLASAAIYPLFVSVE